MEGRTRTSAVSPAARTTRQREAVSGSSPTNAAAPAPPVPYVMRTGRTETSASIAAWNTAGRNAPPLPRPHQVLPSGKTTTREPERRAVATVPTAPGSARSRSRSMKSVAPNPASRPSSGQSRTSVLASIRPGSTAATSGMSSQEMWLATTSSPPPVPRAYGCARTVTRTPKARGMPRAQDRSSHIRDPLGSNRTGAAQTTPSSTHPQPARSRSAARSGGRAAPVCRAQEAGVQEATGSQALVPAGRGAALSSVREVLMPAVRGRGSGGGSAGRSGAARAGRRGRPR